MNTTTTTNTATPRGHKRERSDSSIEILSVRRVRQPKTEPSTPVPPPPEPSTPVPAPPPEPEPEERRRRHPFRRCPPAGFDKIWQRAQTESFTVLRRARCDEPDGCPREHFQLAGTTGNVYTIHVARELRCDCPWALKGNQCKHLVYILHGVLGARYELVYQRSLLKSELRAIFDKFAPPAPATDGGGGGGGGRRRPVEGDCGICDTALGGGGDDGDGEEEEELVWCRARCGKNMHRACFRGWARAGATTCPLCRSPWQWTTRQGASATAAAAGVSTERAVQGEEGYLNVADQLGISSYRDDSEYQRRRARWEARMERMDRYYREFEDYDDEDEAEEDYDDEDEWED